MEPGGYVAGSFRGGQPDTGDMRKRKKLGKGRNNNGTKEKQTALCLVHPCGLLHPAGATLGLINNCAGVFYSRSAKSWDLSWENLQCTGCSTASVSALALPFVATSFRKHDVRIVISIAAVIYGGCAALMGTFHELWQWHLTGIIQGIASSFVCMIPAPIILGNWFKKKTERRWESPRRSPDSSA